MEGTATGRVESSNFSEVGLVLDCRYKEMLVGKLRQLLPVAGGSNLWYVPAA
jgi:hypothetical protein